jgi:maltose/moltooligosaccharide transporter
VASAAVRAVCFAFSFAVPAMVRALGRRLTHSVCLLCGACWLLSVMFIHNQYLLLVSMVGVGMAWAFTFAMPYATVSGALPAENRGVFFVLAALLMRRVVDKDATA